MRTYINYNRLIYLLLDFKDDLKVRIKEKEYKRIIELLGEYEKTGYEDEIIPTRNDISKRLNISNKDTNKLLKKIYMELLNDFYNSPLEINKTQHIIHIHIPFDERKPERIKSDPNFYHEFSGLIYLKLPYIPRVGERINIDVLEYSGEINSGYVHSITHEIKGKMQEINIEVHPIDNEYERWQKMKETYEEKQRMKAYHRYIEGKT